MKLKARKTNIFNYDDFIKETFNDEVEISIRNNFTFFYSDAQKIEHAQLIYIPEAINYIYQVKILGGGLQYKHLAYVKVTWFQHIKISIINFLNFENIFKMLTIICLLASAILPVLKKDSDINIYVSEPKVKNNIVIDSTRNAVNFTDTTKITIDSVTTKKQIK